MKTDVPLFGLRRLGTLSNGVVCVIFDCELYHYRKVRCWHFWHEQEDASGTARPDTRFMFQTRPSAGVQVHEKQWNPEFGAG